MAQPPEEGVIPRDQTVWDYIEPKEPESEPEPQEPEVSAPYDSIDVALDGWEYRLFTEWMGKDEMEQKKNADLFLNILQEYDPSATANVEKSTKHPGSSWVFRFGLFGDPANVTEAIEKVDNQLLGIAQTWETEPGTAKALVTKTDGTEEAYELPRDLISKDTATTLYRLIDLVQTGGVKGSPETESKTSELRQITSPASGEYCTRHSKTGEEHTDEEREDDILGAKGEEVGMEEEIKKLEDELQAWTPGYQAIPKAQMENEQEPLPMPEPEPQPQWNKWRRDVETYQQEMSNLIDTVLNIGKDPMGTPEAIEKTSKVAEDRMEQIVDWAVDLLEKSTEEAWTADVDQDAEAVMAGLQKIIDYGNRFQMLLIEAQEKAKSMAIPE
jgi:hypothetical protein